jgi:predicted ribosomally synthesized peptide with nif11-like leader
MASFTPQHLQAMSEEQLAALLAKLKDDAGLQEKLKGAGDLDAALVIAKEAGFDVSKADWLKYQANQTLELNEEELKGVAGGIPGQFLRDEFSGLPMGSLIGGPLSAHDLINRNP